MKIEEGLKEAENESLNAGIIGLGYVGLPIVLEMCRAGFAVTGFDKDHEKIGMLKEGKSYIQHIESSSIVENLHRFTPTTDFSGLALMDYIVICVPTPLDEHREPDLSYVFDTARTIARYLRKGQVIILESTTYPGTTDEDMRRILEETGLKAGVDFHLAFSPEREDPNNGHFSTRTIPKIVGGYTPSCLQKAVNMYSRIVDKVVPVSSTRVAEAAKLLENIYRAVNIALINELKVLFDRMDIDVWEVIEAARTKPFGFQAFYPGPGLGGHCIPIDPFYLTWKARQYDINTKFIELAGEINTSMPYYVVEKIMDALNGKGKSIKGAKVLVLGAAYKKDVDDMRESPSLKLMGIMTEKGALVDYNDPHIPQIRRLRKYKLDMESVPLTEENLRGYDCAVIATDHSAYDPDFIAGNSQLVIDTRNLIKNPSAWNGKVKKV